MKSTTLAAAIVLSSLCLASQSLIAQLPELSPGITHRGTFDDANAINAVERFRYDRDVKRDTRMTVRFEWLSPEPAEPGKVRIAIGDRDRLAADEATAELSRSATGVVTGTMTVTSSGPLHFALVVPRSSLGHEYTIVITEERHAVKRSITSGLHVAGGWNSVEFASQFSTETGTGASYRFGLGIGPVTVFAERQTAEMLPEGDNPDPADGYTLNHTDLGARVHLFRERNRFRPFGQFSVGRRRLVNGYTDTEAEGIAMTPGAGIELFLLTRLSIEGSYTRGKGDVDRARVTDGEWQDLPDANVIKGTSTRLAVQGVFHF